MRNLTTRDVMMCDLTISEVVKHLQPHPEERPQGRVSKDGSRHGRASDHPSGRRAEARLLRMRSEVLGTLSALLLLLCVGIGSIGAAHAHAFLDHADPRVGSTVKSPRIVSLWFTQDLESAFSSIEVLNSAGASMNVGRASVDPRDRKQLRVAVKALPAGTYTVKWRVLSVDTHTTEGNFTFHVG